jgi:hypothetical protein
MDNDITGNLIGMLQWERIKQLLPNDLYEELEYAIVSMLIGEERALQEVKKMNREFTELLVENFRLKGQIHGHD